jgi:hypothetical protein
MLMRTAFRGSWDAKLSRLRQDKKMSLFSRRNPYHRFCSSQGLFRRYLSAIGQELAGGPEMYALSRERACTVCA